MSSAQHKKKGAKMVKECVRATRGSSSTSGSDGARDVHRAQPALVAARRSEEKGAKMGSEENGGEMGRQCEMGGRSG